MDSGHNFGEFRPEQISRRGEFIAWCSALVVIIGWLIVRLNSQPVHPAVPILAILLLFAGLSISLGNWMDRRTRIQLDDSGIAFQNGLRNVRLAWQDIIQVRLFPARWGKKVQVFGEKAFFEFLTLSEVKYQGESKARFGFEKGEDILRQIIISADLQPSEHPEEGYYYVRK